MSVSSLISLIGIDLAVLQSVPNFVTSYECGIFVWNEAEIFLLQLKMQTCVSASLC